MPPIVRCGLIQARPAYFKYPCGVRCRRTLPRQCRKHQIPDGHPDSGRNPTPRGMKATRCLKTHYRRIGVCIYLHFTEGRGLFG
jgi:hypothetical protein